MFFSLNKKLIYTITVFFLFTSLIFIYAFYILNANKIRANREYNASERGGFGSGYAGRGSSASGFGSGSSAPRTSGSSGFGAGYGRPAAPKAASKPVSFPGSPAASRPASTGPKHYEVGDIVEHKVFGRGRVLAVKAAAGDQIVEINFEKVGVKKTMANFAPLTKITEE